MFRPGCLTGPSHKGVQLHGFLAYLARCAAQEIPYTIIGHAGKQVRDNIHAFDFAKALITVAEGSPRFGEVYNFGGGRYSNCSTLEAVAILEELTGKRMDITYQPTPRIGDHIWYIGSTEKFLNHYPKFTYTYTQEGMIQEMIDRYVKS